MSLIESRAQAQTNGDGNGDASRAMPGMLAFLQRLLRLAERPPRRLRLCESLGLGERRFVAVIEFERRRFLVGGTAQSLVLLARLDEVERDEAEPAAAGKDLEEAIR